MPLGYLLKGTEDTYMQQKTIYYDSIIPPKYRLFYALQGLFYLVISWIQLDYHAGIDSFKYIFIAAGALVIVMAAFYPYFKKKLGRVYVAFHKYGIILRLNQFKSKSEIAAQNIRTLEIHPTSFRICLESGKERDVRFPADYQMLQESRAIVIHWAEEHNVRFTDWRIKQKMVPG